MTQIFENDLAFLEKETKLSREKIECLTETSRDFDLVIDSLSGLEIDKKTLLNLSFETFTKYIIFKYSKKLNYSDAEKQYISNIVSNYFPRLQININFEYLSVANTSERLSKYYLVLMGFFYKKLKRNFFTPKIWRQTEEGFRKGDVKETADHLEQWVKILQQIENDNWFLTNKTKRGKVCPPKKLLVLR